MMCCLDWMQRLSRSLIRFETQDIKTQPLFNHNFSLDFFPFNNWLNSWRSQGTSLFQTACSSSLDFFILGRFESQLRNYFLLQPTAKGKEKKKLLLAVGWACVKKRLLFVPLSPWSVIKKSVTAER